MTRIRAPWDAGRHAERFVRLASMALGAVLLVQLITLVLVGPRIPGFIGHDYSIYNDAALRWLNGEAFYPDAQRNGPYWIGREVLYPPVALVLFAPFTMLPAILWVVIPLGILAWLVVVSKPSPLRWTLILFLLVFPVLWPLSWAMQLVVSGNPVMWVAAFVGLAFRFPVFGPFALLKPTPLLIPFALVGIRARSWWLGLAAFAGASVLFLPMWVDYSRVLFNARGNLVLYAFESLAVVLIPVVALAGGLSPGASNATAFPVEPSSPADTESGTHR